MKKRLILLSIGICLASISQTFAQGTWLPNNYSTFTPGGFMSDREVRVGSALTGTGKVGFIKHGWAGAFPIINEEFGIYTWQDASPIRIGGNLVKFETEQGVANNVYMSGNLGIGTKTPAHRLDVKTVGDIGLSCSNIKILTSSGPQLAIYGEAQNNTGIGTGGAFHGGHIGVAGEVVQDLDNLTASQLNDPFYDINAVHGHADNLGTQNSRWAIGVWGQGYVTSATATAIGVYCRAGSTHTGSTNHWALYADGRTFEASGTGLWTSSDQRLKKNVKNVGSALELVNKLEPKSYEYKTDGKFSTANFAQGKIYGFLAQDLEKVIPEMVTTAPIKFNAKDKDDKNDYTEDYKAVSYQMLIPVLTQAIKEQQKEIVDLRDELMNLKETIAKVAGVTSVGDIVDNGSVLSQNIPNPFNVSTEIPYRLNNDVTNAFIYITNLSGKLIKKYNISGNDKEGSVNISADNLADGMYIYTLIANDKIVDSKRMIVAK